MADKQTIREAQEAICGHAIIIQKLLDGFEVLVCVETGAVIIGLPLSIRNQLPGLTEAQLSGMKFTTYFAKEGPRCDPIYDLHLPIHRVQSLAALRKAKETLDKILVES